MGSGPRGLRFLRWVALCLHCIRELGKSQNFRARRAQAGRKHASASIHTISSGTVSDIKSVEVGGRRHTAHFSTKLTLPIYKLLHLSPLYEARANRCASLDADLRLGCNRRPVVRRSDGAYSVLHIWAAERYASPAACTLLELLEC